jgi:hypothetical protein
MGGGNEPGHSRAVSEMKECGEGVQPSALCVRTAMTLRAGGRQRYPCAAGGLRCCASAVPSGIIADGAAGLAA